MIFLSSSPHLPSGLILPLWSRRSAPRWPLMLTVVEQEERTNDRPAGVAQDFRASWAFARDVPHARLQCPWIPRDMMAMKAHAGVRGQEGEGSAHFMHGRSQSYYDRPWHPSNAGTEHVEFSPTRGRHRVHQERSAVRCSREPREG